MLVHISVKKAGSHLSMRFPQPALSVCPSRSLTSPKRKAPMGCPGILLGWMGSTEAWGHKGQSGERQGAGTGICSWHSCLLA